jgi:hypothetical protein
MKSPNTAFALWLSVCVIVVGMALPEVVFVVSAYLAAPQASAKDRQTERETKVLANSVKGHIAAMHVRVPGSVKGHIAAMHVRVPATLKLTGDTTIVSDVLELESPKTRIVTNGHDLRLITKGEVRRTGTDGSQPMAETIIIDTSSGSQGTMGTQGFPGAFGGYGAPGAHSDFRPYDCWGEPNGRNGEAGGKGESGGSGGSGGVGGDAGAIALAIPQGSQDSYILRARGATGGTGGTGGRGGDGGYGGQGGNGGGDTYGICGGHAGNGGNGGAGGDGGQGGTGGSGGNGGKGGNITINYPPGYDRSKVTFELNGGGGGPGGNPGFGGAPGQGGFGGSPGCSTIGCGSPGATGPGGLVRGPGVTGNGGDQGANGVVTEGEVIALNVDKSAYIVGESPTYSIVARPNSPIYWTSFKDGVSTGEDHAFYGQYTDASGRATVQGQAWTDNDVSANWVKQITVEGRDASVRFQVREGGPWADWSRLGGGTADQVAVGSCSPCAGSPGGTLLLYAAVRGWDNAIYVNDVINGNERPAIWRGWQSLGGNASSRPVFVLPLRQGVENPIPHIFARAADGSVIYTQRTAGGWTGWTSLGGYILGAPAVVKTGSGNPLEGSATQPLMVIARGGDNGLYVNQQIGAGWSGWQALGGAATSDPVAVQRVGSSELQKQVQLFARNGNGAVMTRLYNGFGWEGWQDLGGIIQGNPAAVAAVNHNQGFMPYTFVFGRGSNNALHVNRLDSGGWSGWQSLGGVIHSDPNASAGNSNSTPVYVAARGSDDAIHQIGWTRSAGWQGWVPRGGSTTLAVGMNTRTGGAELLGVDETSGRIYHRYSF